jgi:hypothetical protein
MFFWLPLHWEKEDLYKRTSGQWYLNYPAKLAFQHPSTNFTQIFTKANDSSDESFETQTTCWENVPSPVIKSMNQRLVKEVSTKG